MTRERWRSSRPRLTRDNELVIAVWNFCAGWNPQALPLALAYYEIQDADFMIAQLLALRRKIDEHAAAQEARDG
jgi:hypothetical protein